MLRVVVLPFVVGEHTIGSELRCYLANGILDKVAPLYGDTITVLVIVSRSYLVFYDIVYQLGIQFVLVLLVFVSTFLREHPAGILAIALYPPAVQYTEVHYPVHSSFFPTGTRGFQRACRSIHPYIHPLDKCTRQVHIVVGEEDNFA